MTTADGGSVYSTSPFTRFAIWFVLRLTGHQLTTQEGVEVHGVVSRPASLLRQHHLFRGRSLGQSFCQHGHRIVRDVVQVSTLLRRHGNSLLESLRVYGQIAPEVEAVFKLQLVFVHFHGSRAWVTEDNGHGMLVGNDDGSICRYYVGEYSTYLFQGEFDFLRYHR